MTGLKHSRHSRGAQYGATGCRRPAGQVERPEHVEVLVIGAGQAGLVVGWHLREQGIRSPGLAFTAPAGAHPTKDEVADYLRGYAAAFELPVRPNTAVTRLTQTGDTFVAATSTGTVTAHQVVIATGPFQTPVIPRTAGVLAAEVVQVHSAEYRNPEQLPDGPVLVVGAGNSGLQIACELAATRAVTVAVGTRPPMLPQRFLGRDLFWWLTRLGLITKPADPWFARRVRDKGDLVTGARWRDLARRGITSVPGLSIVGLPWLHTRGSALLGFVKDDAARLADHIRDQVAVTRGRAPAGDLFV